jgi:hypothetical protein
MARTDVTPADTARTKPPRRRPENLSGLLGQLAELGGTKSISVRELLDALGRRSFAPLLLIVSLLGFTPFGVIPGVPTTLAAFVVLIAGQIAIGSTRVWLPGFMLDWCIDGGRLNKAATVLRPFARVVDVVIRPRFAALTEPPFAQLLGAACVLIAFTVPPLEFIPLIDIPLWAALVAFSLALFAHDGLLAALALLLTVAGISLMLMAM